jgi:cyanoexosortase A
VNLSWNTLTKEPQFWLVALLAGLAAIYMTLVWRSGDTAHLGMSGLFWLAMASLLWDRRHQIQLSPGLNLTPTHPTPVQSPNSESRPESNSEPNSKSNAIPGIGATLMGIMIIGLILWQSNALIDSPDLNKDRFNANLYFLRLSPWLSGLGVALLASGFAKIRQFWRELVILFFMGAPSVAASFLVDISPITAKFSAFLLWYTGFDILLQGKFIYVKLSESLQGAVEVYEGCSGIESMTYLLGLSVVCLVMFPIARFKQWFVPPMALVLGFIINGIRVSLMAVLSASGDKAAFDYWHEGEGSLLFGLFAVLALGGIYMFVLGQEEAAAATSTGSTPGSTPEVATVPASSSNDSGFLLGTSSHDSHTSHGGQSSEQIDQSIDQWLQSYDNSDSPDYLDEFWLPNDDNG